MKIREIKNPTKNQKKILFVDMDGVLVAFHSNIRQHLPDFNFADYQKDANLRKKFWDLVIELTNDGKEVWFESDKMKDADDLWDFVRDYDVEILTATGKSIPQQAAEQKRKWMKKHYNYTKVHTVLTGKHKAKFAKDGNILIDDMKRNIEAWEAAGGVGILHTTAASTIKKLKQLGY